MGDLRDKVLQFIETYGSKHIWFARQLGISQTHWRLWLNRERELSEPREAKLREILEK